MSPCLRFQQYRQNPTTANAVPLPLTREAIKRAAKAPLVQKRFGLTKQRAAKAPLVQKQLGLTKQRAAEASLVQKEFDFTKQRTAKAPLVKGERATEGGEGIHKDFIYEL